MDKIMASNTKRADFVKISREERAWTQSQLAEVAGVNLRTIQRVEKDGSASFETLMGIAQAFDIDVKELSPSSGSNSLKGKNHSQKKVYLLPRLISGKNLTDVILGVDQFQFEYDEANDRRSINAMKDILELLKGDVVRLYDADPVARLNIELELSQEIKGLEMHGFYLFGIKRVIPRNNNEKKTRVVMCTLFMSHSHSPKIIQDKNLNMIIPAVLAEVAR